MIYGQNLKWKEEKEIDSWKFASVFLACSTKFLLTYLPISHLLQSSGKQVSHWIPLALLIESSTLNLTSLFTKQKGEKKDCI